MTWVEINQELCTQCGICVERCARCFSEEDGLIVANAGEITCNLCGHCVSLCPADAITLLKMDMGQFAEIPQQTQIDPETFIQFIKQRRSHRHFQDKPIAEKDLETLLDVGRFAPTGSNVQNTEIILYTNREKIKKVSDLTGDYFRWIKERVREPLARLEADGKQDTDEYRFYVRNLYFADRFATAKAEGKDPLFYDAPCVMFFHSPEQTSTPKDNAVLIAHTMALTARTMGIETCYIGLIVPAANDYPPLKEEFNIPEGHKIFYTMIMGYPRLQYLKTVDRKPIKTRRA